MNLIVEKEFILRETILNQMNKKNKKFNVIGQKALNFTQIIVKRIIHLYSNFYKGLNYKVLFICIIYFRALKIEKKLFYELIHTTSSIFIKKFKQF